MDKKEQKLKDESVNDRNCMQELEDALVLCKFGRFNIRLLLATLLTTFANTMITITSSYILPSAECDLKMTISQKGLLNAMPFIGQVGASLFTGFLIDAFGRKPFLVGGNIGSLLCFLLEGSSQNFEFLALGKLINGIFLSFTFSASAALLTEVSHKNIRDTMMVLFASFMSLSMIMVALLSWANLIEPMTIVLIENYFVLHSWNIYLYVSSIWSLLAAIAYYHLPESPKYLLSHGQEKLAVEVLQSMFFENTHQNKEIFPVKGLGISKNDVLINEKLSLHTKMIDGFKEINKLFKKPLFKSFLLNTLITFVTLAAVSSLRLWYPQLSTIIENYEKNNINNKQQFCDIINDYMNISDVVSSNSSVEPICKEELSGHKTYINGIIMGLASLFCISISAYFVKFVNQKILMFICLVMSTIFSISIYWTRTSFQVATAISASVGLTQASMSLQNSIMMRVFPTTLRALSFSITLMIGRIGSLLGNIFFPKLLEIGCMGPFVLLSSVSLGIAGIVYFLPNPQKENMSGDQ